jgi:hypothetical protein
LKENFMKKLVITLLFVSMLSLAPSVRPQKHNPQMTPDNGTEMLTYDVAVDNRTFRLQNDVNPFASMPPALARGDAFVVDGKIYPGGTILQGGTPQSPGPFNLDTAPGSLGGWICRGIFLVNFADIAAGASIHVNTTQLFEFTDGRGLVTEGLEGAVPTVRAVLGGMGRWSGANGEVRQELLGTNATGGFNVHLTFEIKRQSID